MYVYTLINAHLIPSPINIIFWDYGLWQIMVCDSG